MRKGGPAKPLSVKKNTLLGYIRSSNHHEIQCVSAENDIVAPILDNLIALVAKKEESMMGTVSEPKLLRIHFSIYCTCYGSV